MILIEKVAFELTQDSTDDRNIPTTTTAYRIPPPKMAEVAVSTTNIHESVSGDDEVAQSDMANETYTYINTQQRLVELPDSVGDTALNQDQEVLLGTTTTASVSTAQPQNSTASTPEVDADLEGSKRRNEKHAGFFDIPLELRHNIYLRAIRPDCKLDH